MGKISMIMSCNYSRDTLFALPCQDFIRYTQKFAKIRKNLRHGGWVFHFPHFLTPSSRPDHHRF